MDRSIAELFIILALNPKKGRVSINTIHYRYTLAGALFMDLLENDEIKIENAKVIPVFKQNGYQLHDMIINTIMKSDKTRKISFWIRRLANKSRIIFKEIISSLEKERLIRKEHKKFLHIIPYYKYWFNDPGIRISLIELLRGILLYGKTPGNKEIMLLSLVDLSRAYHCISRERGESKILRKKNSELLSGDLISTEILQAIKEVKTAITAAKMAAHGAH